MSHPGRTRRSALATALSVASVALVTAAGAATSPAAADPDPSMPDVLSAARADAAAQTGTLVSARTVLTSTTGKKLTLDVTGFRSSEGSTVVVALSQQGESHSWSFPAKASAVAINGKGAGTIDLPAQAMGGAGKLALTFSPSGAVKKQTCQGSLASKRRPVSVRGVAQLKTGTAGWGDVGSAKKPTTFRTSQVMWSYDAECPAPAAPCVDTLSWNGFDTAGQVVTGISGSVVAGDSSLTAYRSTPLAAPAGAYRTDLVTVPDAPAPTLSGPEDEKTLRAELGDGSLSIEGSAAGTETSPCESGDTLAETSWFGTVSNGTRAFTVPAQVFGDFTLADDAFASFTRSVA